MLLSVAFSFGFACATVYASALVTTNLNPLTLRVKRRVVQSFLTFDCMDRTLKCDHSLENC